MNIFIRFGWIAWVFVFFLTTFLYASAITSFERYLQVGDRGEDVLFLQRILNTDPDTIVAPQGPGSLGQETTYFGKATKQGVIKLQKKFDLGEEHGFFIIYSGGLDEKTRNFLNEAYFNTDYMYGTSTMSTSTRQKTINQMYKKGAGMLPGTPVINSSDKLVVVNGDEITLSGKNFSTTTANTLTIGYNTLSVVAKEPNTLTFKMDSALRDMYLKRMKDMDANDRKKAFKQVPEIPIFITARNDKGTSNAYLVYLRINE